MLPTRETSTPRGWIAPEDRLWRHPSEVSDLEHGLRSTLTGRWHHATSGASDRAAIAAGTLGAAAVVVAAVVVLALMDAPSATTERDPRSRAAETSLVTVPATPRLGRGEHLGADLVATSVLGRVSSPPA